MMTHTGTVHVGAHGRVIIIGDGGVSIECDGRSLIKSEWPKLYNVMCIPQRETRSQRLKRLILMRPAPPWRGAYGETEETFRVPDMRARRPEA